MLVMKSHKSLESDLRGHDFSKIIKVDFALYNRVLSLEHMLNLIMCKFDPSYSRGPNQVLPINIALVAVVVEFPNPLNRLIFLLYKSCIEDMCESFESYLL
jgi:hypothetical protein